MKVLFILGVVFLVGGFVFAMRGRYAQPHPILSQDHITFYDHSISGLEGGIINMSDYKGKYVLCVNVASKCGFTPQYEGLQELYTKYGDKLVVIGFPCNQFLFQEPGKPSEIADFCRENYDVTFPLTEKIDVKGKKQNVLYQWLTLKSLNGVADVEVKWNFHKILVSPEGKWLKSYPSSVDPMSDEITTLIQ